MESDQRFSCEDSRQLRETVSWRIVTELWRRFPEQFVLLETHPADGQYDCLTLYERGNDSGARLELNRNGSLHIHQDFSGRIAPSCWEDWLSRMITAPPERFLDELTGSLGLQIPKKLPISSASTITYRFIGEFLTHSIGRREFWECRNGVLDSSGWGGKGRRDDLFVLFPEISRNAVPRRHDILALSTDYFYWFLLKEHDPLLCLNTDGALFTRAGEVFSLPSLFQKTRSIWGIIGQVAGDLLP